MKIRTDFVTNSSSSSYSVLITVETTDGRSVTFYEPSNMYNEISEVYFSEHLDEILERGAKRIKEEYLSVANLANFLMDSVHGDYEEFKEDYWGNNLEFKSKMNKEKFVRELVRKAKSISDISRITVCRKYDSNGEFAELIASDDKELNELAENVLRFSGDEKIKAMQEMRNCLNTPSKDRMGESGFGYGYEVRYNWSGDDNDLIEMAKCLEKDPSCTGREYRELDLVTGVYSKHAEYNL